STTRYAIHAAASVRAIGQKYAPTNPISSRLGSAARETARSARRHSPALHAHDAFPWVMQLMGLERVVRVSGADGAHFQPFAQPAFDDVDVVHQTCPRLCDDLGRELSADRATPANHVWTYSATEPSSSSRNFFPQCWPPNA